MHSCEVQFLQNPKLGTGRFQQQSQARSQRAIRLSCALSVHSIRSSRSTYLIRTNSFETTCRRKRGSSGMVDHPLRNSATMQSGVVGKDGCSDAVGPHNQRICMQMWRRSRVSQTGCTHAQHCGQYYKKTGYSHGDRPQMAIAGVHHTCHIIASQMYEEHHYTTISDSQFAGSHRGRKRLSREATRRTVLALEWPGLVQIGHCKVHWLPNTANKRNRFANIR